ncbi:uncharacterized protein LOC117180660 [Belonocnema kinseyi]|uniref:uncharacterized protein LOC117180660 n=1 Tax=Belonocnema kinseyi TaxID=2817044 RepID=UPI00143D4C07|nr:uncharacterized protein LOC117180660 [Belonocnema kinseyi]
MELTAEQKTRVAYIEKKGKSLEEQIEKLDQFLKASSVDPINAKLRLDSLTTLYTSYVKYNDELSSLKFDHPRLDAFDDIQTCYFNVATAVTKLQKTEVALYSPHASSTLNSSNFTLTERQDLPRLPEIHIPRFNGDHTEWVAWKASFTSIVHNRTDISNYTKHTHLQTALRDRKAEGKIKQYPASEENYPQAFKALCDA